MKIEIKGEPPIIIGKRVGVGAAIMSGAAGLSNFFPDHAAAIVSFAVPITFFVQLWIVNKFGVTK